MHDDVHLWIQRIIHIKNIFKIKRYFNGLNILFLFIFGKFLSYNFAFQYLLQIISIKRFCLIFED